ncbi:MAG: xanthine dehydrogenase small subunit [Pseudomonadota bacterium]
MIRFLHGFEEVSISEARSDTTVLSYLRNQRNLKGTKEGCASGDCGACTVVTTRQVAGELRYEPVNACIATLGSLHGKQLISVEQLSEERPHPVQQAMIDAHGSQCGFCTPGFVMSLFALYQRRLSINGVGQESGESKDTGDHLVHEALGGNLCRCTGYRPIVDAAHQALSYDGRDCFEMAERETMQKLALIEAEDSSSLGLSCEDTRYLRPRNAQEVALLLQEFPEARLIAGGTDLLLEHTQLLRPLPFLIDLKAVPELAHLEVDQTHLRIGAAVTHTDAQKPLTDEYPELQELIERFGSTQIRSQGTVVGNIANASPIGDWPPVMIALGASLVLQSAHSTRELPIGDYFLDYKKTALAPGEFIRELKIPRRIPGLFLRAYKISKRYEDDISSVCAVFALTLDEQQISQVTIGFGGMAAIPTRAFEVEKCLQGAQLSPELIDDAAKLLKREFTPISDARASARYRSTVAANLLRRLAVELADEQPTRTHPVVLACAHG